MYGHDFSILGNSATALALSGGGVILGREALPYDGVLMEGPAG